MSTGITLDQNHAAEVLDRYRLSDALSMAGALMDQGYVLVAVSGPALEQATDRGDLSYLPPAAPEQAARIEQWCAPERVS